MKDADARERLDRLEQALDGLPKLVADAVVRATQPTLARLTEFAESVEHTLAEVQAVVAKVDDSTELFGVVEQELKELRAEGAAHREFTAALSQEVVDVAARVTTIVRTLTRVGHQA